MKQKTVTWRAEAHMWRELPIKMADVQYSIGGQAGHIVGEKFYYCAACGLVCLCAGGYFPGVKCIATRDREP